MTDKVLKYKQLSADHSESFSYNKMGNNGNTEQVTNYYPSGTVIAEYPRRTDQGVQPYKFGTKELDRSNGLDFYDFEARSYNSALMRFTTSDPLRELRPWESPYCFTGNNPVNRTDSDGRFWNYVAGAFIGGAVEYGSQVVGNIVENGFSASAFTDNIDLIDIGIAMGEGALTCGASAIKSVAAKTTIKVVSSVVQNTIDATIEKGIQTEKNVTKIAVKTAIDMGGDAVGNALPKKSVTVAKETTGNKAVRAAREQASAKGEKLTKWQADNVRKSVAEKIIRLEE